MQTFFFFKLYYLYYFPSSPPCMCARSTSPAVPQPEPQAGPCHAGVLPLMRVACAGWCVVCRQGHNARARPSHNSGARADVDWALHAQGWQQGFSNSYLSLSMAPALTAARAPSTGRVAPPTARSAPMTRGAAHASGVRLRCYTCDTICIPHTTHVHWCALGAAWLSHACMQPSICP